NSVAAVAKNLPAPLKCVDAVAASVSKPFDEGMRYERELFMQLIQSPESRALRHAFFGERAAAKIPDVPPETPTRKVERVAVIESEFEDMGGKEGVYRKLDEIMKPGAILATNTSTLDVDKIADFTKRPQDVVGMHFFSPANIMKLLEVVRGKKTAKDVMATVM